MIGFANPAEFPFESGLSPDFMDWGYLRGIFDTLPERFKAPAAAGYKRKRAGEGQRAANTWIRETIAETLTTEYISLAASDSEICIFAKRRADSVRAMLAREVGTDAATMRGRLIAHAAAYDATLPDDCELRGIVARLTDPAYWRRQVRRNVARREEGAAIELGFVHRRAGCYASDETVSRHQGQQARNRKALEETIAVNEEKQEYTLAELSDVGISNPDVRRAELMTRIRGFEEFSTAAGHVGMFYTWTLPSRFHARLSKSGQENPKYDGSTPKEGAGFLSKQWAKFRAWLSRKGLYPYGFRVAEPHHDGTPHWHLLLFMPEGVEQTITEKMQEYAWKPDAYELTSEEAREARFKAIKIDPARGTAAGYISKYVCKNIDGKTATGESLGAEFDEHDGGDAIEGAARVRAWASCWAIRQFQQIGGPGVGIWRELRRLREVQQGELFPYWNPADKGDWNGYLEIMGGVAIRRNLRPVQVWREAMPEKLNRYAEPAAPETCGVEFCRVEVPKAPQWVKVETRIHQWTIRRKHEGQERKPGLPGGYVEGQGMCAGLGDSGCSDGTGPCGKAGEGLARPKAAQPWTRVNNCTPHWWGPEVEAVTTAKDFDGAPLGSYREMAREWEKWAVFERISYRRKAGAFGRFPAPPGER